MIGYTVVKDITQSKYLPSPFFSSLDFCSARSAKKCKGDWDSGGVMGALPVSLPELLSPSPPLVSALVPPWSEFC